MEGNNGARRTEDIALDLLKFVAATAHVGMKAPGGAGFGVSASAKPDDQVAELLALYGRCRRRLRLRSSRWGQVRGSRFEVRGRTGGRFVLRSGTLPVRLPMSLPAIGANEKLRVAVVGAGTFGRNHLRVYRELERSGYPVELVAVVDPDAGARDRAAADFGVRGFATIEEMHGCGAEPT